MPHVAIAKADDWIALYVDGRAVYQGHSIEPSCLLNYLQIEHQYEWANNQAYALGWFPDQWSEVRNDEQWNQDFGLDPYNA